MVAGVHLTAGVYVKHGDSVLQAAYQKQGNAPMMRPLRLLVHTPHPERIPMLVEQYACLPWHILFAVAEENTAACLEACASGTCTCVDLPRDCDSSKMGGILGLPAGSVHNLLIAPHADGSTDLVYAHSDMWLSRSMPSFIRSRPPNTILLPAGLDPHCMPLGAKVDLDEDIRFHNGNTSTMWNTFRNACEAMLRRESAQAATEANDEDEATRLIRVANVCCFGWSDFLYLPAAAQPLFAAMATGPMRGRNATDGLSEHEGAIHTIVNAIVSAPRSPFVAEDAACLGSCCGLEGGYDALSPDTRCAHPVDLRNSSGWDEARAAAGECPQ